MKTIIKLVLTLALLIDGNLQAGTLTLRPLSLDGKSYQKISKHRVPLMFGGQYLDLSELSGEDSSLKDIQKDYERYKYLLNYSWTF